MRDSCTPNRVLLVSEQTHTSIHTHTHTEIEAYSPDEGDHLLHHEPAEGDDHKQFLMTKKHTERENLLLNHEVSA